MELGQRDLIRAAPTATTTARDTMTGLQLVLDTTEAELVNDQTTTFPKYL